MVAVPDLKAAIGILADLDPLAGECTADLVRLENEQRFVIVQRQRLRDCAPLTPDKLRAQIVMWSQRPV